MKIHAVFLTKIHQLWSREISYCCSNCFGPSFKPPSLCDGWTEHSLWKDVAALPKILPHSQLESDGKKSKEADFPMLIEIKEMASFAAGYSENSQVYIGSIIKFDDKDALISSIEHGTADHWMPEVFWSGQLRFESQDALFCAWFQSQFRLTLCNLFNLIYVIYVQLQG